MSKYHLFLSLDIAQKVEDAAENINTEVAAILMKDQQQIYFGKPRRLKKKQQLREFNEKRSSLERRQEELNKSILKTQQFKSKLGNCEEKSIYFQK